MSRYTTQLRLSSNTLDRSTATSQLLTVSCTLQSILSQANELGLGLRIMTFGVLFDFTGNSNASKIINAADLVKQQWFLDAVNFSEPVDLFLLIGHNPIRGSGSTFSLIHDTIRSLRPNIPIQGFGGHTHIRDFTVYDDKSTALESGRSLIFVLLIPL